MQKVPEMPVKIDLESICRKAEIFRCIYHKKYPLLKIEADFVVISACCNRFHDHIESFIERQIELANNQERHDEI